MRRRAFRIALACLMAGGMAARIGYVLAQPASDPSFARPILDGAYYLDWARGILEGSGPAGAFYLAPLYAYALAGFLAVAGESFTLLYLLQQAAGVAAAGILALSARRSVGEWAGLAAAVLLLTYHPALFFASRPMGETLAILLLVTALGFLSREDLRCGALSGIACGLAALARPNLLLVAVVWAGIEAAGRRWRRAALLTAGVVIVVLPVTVRNALISGHPVLISSNAGVTFCQGNAPGAKGIHVRLPGLSGSLADQRSEATAMASLRTGRRLDPVEADRWWGWHALRARAERPGDTAILAGRRLLLSVAEEEIGLDYAPGLDRNPWRCAAPVPFALILGMAAVGLGLRGVRGSGGWVVWGAVLACAVAPWVFYVSSRYRLPAVAVLCLPAAAGLVAFASLWKSADWKRLARAAGVGCVVALASFWVPTSGVSAPAEAQALANRASAWLDAGDPAAAERDLHEALERDPRSTAAYFNLGVVLEATGRETDAEATYRQALDIDPGHAESAGNLAGMLIREGRPVEAVPVLRRAIEARPYDRVCRTNLVVALAETGDETAARDAALKARRLGIDLDPGLAAAIGFRETPAGSGSGDGTPP